MRSDHILIYGGSGFMGRLIALATAKEGLPTTVVVRETTRRDKEKLCTELKEAGIKLVDGDMTDEASVVRLLKELQPAAVISSVAGPKLLAKQQILVDAIAQHSPSTRFLPSEFSVDNDSDPQGCPAVYAVKQQLQAYIIKAGIPYTLVTCSGFAEDWASALGQMGPRWEPPGPGDETIIFGTGDVKGYMTVSEDTAAFTAKAVLDPRTLNKRLHIRLPSNLLSQRDLIATWERLAGHPVKTSVMTAQEVDDSISGKAPLLHGRTSASYETEVFRQLERSMWIYGDYCKPLPANGVDALSLYPDVPTTSIETYLQRYVSSK